MQDQCSQHKRVTRRGGKRRSRTLAVLLIAAAIPLSAPVAQEPAPSAPASPSPPAAEPSPPASSAPATGPSQATPAPETDNAPRQTDPRESRQDRREERADRERERRHSRDWRRTMGPFALAPLCGPRFGRLIDNDLRRIARAVVPTEAQRGPFDELRAAAAKARDYAQEGCNEPAARTPAGRLQLIEERLASVQQAVHTLRPPLDAFYATLSDEQKERFNDLNLSMTSGGNGLPQERRHRWRYRDHGPFWPFWR